MKEKSRTKLLVTLGPSSADVDVLTDMIREGIDACRINFSHGDRGQHLSFMNLVKNINERMDTHVALLADLRGAKIRVGNITGGSITLRPGETFRLTVDGRTGDSSGVSVNYPPLPDEVEPGDVILLDDGRIRLEVTDTVPGDHVIARVIHGGVLLPGKGVNLPSSKLSLPGLTIADEEDALFAAKNGVDWIAVSFVKSAEDMERLRKRLRGYEVRLIAKIERSEAVRRLDEIVEASDAVMVARGDLGVEMNFDEVPILQKTIVRKCMESATPVIIATQMMESMIERSRPTRAEAADVANAVLDGADTLMLSGETAMGRHPVLVVKSMQAIINTTEKHGMPPLRRSASPGSIPDFICRSAVDMAERAGARAIVTFTHSGYTAVRISSHRPEAGIFAFTTNPGLLSILSLVWGVRAFHLDSTGHIKDYVQRSLEFLKKRDLVRKGDLVVHVGSIPLQLRGRTNMLKLTKV